MFASQSGLASLGQGVFELRMQSFELLRRKPGEASQDTWLDDKTFVEEHGFSLHQMRQIYNRPYCATTLIYLQLT